MATRLYLSAAAETVPITPTPDSGWEDTSIFQRVLCGKGKRLLPMTTISFTDSNSASKDILFRQYISPELVPGQNLVFTAGDSFIEAVCRVMLTGSGADMRLTIGARIIASDGVTVQKTILNVTRDNVVATNDALKSRAFFNSNLSGSYTTIEGDRLVIEIGMGGDPPG